MSKLIDLTNQDFGYWHVIERAPNNVAGRARWKCLCTACGTKKIVDGGHLRGGRSTNCGCIRTEKMRQACIKDETGKQYGYLLVQRQATKEEKPRIDSYGVYWICKCLHCGKEKVVVKGDYLRNGDTTSCGCIVSKNESLIAEMLEKSNIKYKEQFTFQDLSSTGRSCDKLMFDFAIFNGNSLLYLIEYDGIQHFKYNISGWNNKEQFERTHKNDLLKNRYCFEHNIPLIRIPYNIQYNLNDLKLETTRFLLTKDKENNYYDNR